MLIQKFAPSARLQKLIKCYYYIEKHDEALLHDRYFADGCVEVVFSTGWEFFKNDTKEPWAKIIGQIIQPRELDIVGKGRSFGVWFYPHAFSWFYQGNLSELNDRVAAWDELFPGWISERVGEFLSQGQVEGLVSLMDQFWLQRLATRRDTQADNLVGFSIGHLYEHKGAADLRKLHEMLSVSDRYLQKLFSTRVGLTPKQAVRIFRFQEAVQHLTDHQSSLTRLAYDHHFYDQSHFVREFKQFTGFRPSQFDKASLPINQHFLATD